MIKLYYTDFSIRDTEQVMKEQEKYRDLLFEEIKKLNNIDASISYNEHGKPYFNNSNQYFNISHSKEMILIGFSDQEIGVDIEKIRENKNLEKMFNKICNDNDYNFFINDDLSTFYVIWTIKEAYLKSIGIGLINNIKDIYIDYENKTVELLGKERLNCDWAIINDYAISVVTGEAIKNNIVDMLIKIKV